MKKDDDAAEREEELTTAGELIQLQTFEIFWCRDIINSRPFTASDSRTLNLGFNTGQLAVETSQSTLEIIIVLKRPLYDKDMESNRID